MTTALIDPARLIPLLGPLAARFDVDALAEASSSSDLLFERAAWRRFRQRRRRPADRRPRPLGRNWASAPEASLTFSPALAFRWRRRTTGWPLACRRRCAGPCTGCSRRAWYRPQMAERCLARRSQALPASLLNSERAARHGRGDRHRYQSFPPPASALDLPAAALTDALPALADRHLLLAGPSPSWRRVLDAFAASGFASVRDAWQAAHAWQGDRSACCATAASSSLASAAAPMPTAPC